MVHTIYIKIHVLAPNGTKLRPVWEDLSLLLNLPLLAGLLGGKCRFKCR